MIQKIQTALQQLGVKNWQTAYAVRSSAFVAEVYVDGEYFGLWDVVKDVFVE